MNDCHDNYGFKVSSNGRSLLFPLAPIQEREPSVVVTPLDDALQSYLDMKDSLHNNNNNNNGNGNSDSNNDYSNQKHEENQEESQIIDDAVFSPTLATLSSWSVSKTCSSSSSAEETTDQDFKHESHHDHDGIVETEYSPLNIVNSWNVIEELASPNLTDDYLQNSHHHHHHHHHHQGNSLLMLVLQQQVPSTTTTQSVMEVAVTSESSVDNENATKPGDDIFSAYISL